MYKTWPTLVVLTVLVLNSELTAGSTILSISMMSSKSHKNVFEPLLIKLANRGHRVTIVSPIKSNQNHRNIREILGIPYETMMGSGSDEMNFFEMKAKKEDMNPFTSFIPLFEKYGAEFLRLPQVKSILGEEFDLVIFSGFMNECIMGILQHLKSPYIMTIPFAASFWQVSPLGNPVPISFSPNMFLGYTDEMSFFQRVNNLIAFVGFSVMFDYYYYPKMENIYRDYFGQDTASIDMIWKNSSLILSNGHFTLNFPRPMLPEVIDVGGMHCRAAQPLPQDLEDFAAGSGKDGFVYFSMGSIVQGHTMPEKSRQMFVNVFSKLKQRVIWKWESETMENLPKNVKLGKWLPQQDILGHPNIRMFITHGGLLSTEEAVYHGVPLVGFPMFGDQDWSMKHAESLGIALSRDFIHITEEELLSTINEILTEQKFKENVQALSKVFSDRPQKPLETALYWTEYVMRHKGAVHLRSAARDLTAVQYHSLDVIAFIIVSLFTLLYIFFTAVRFLLRKLCGTTNPSIEKQKQLRKKNK